MPFEFTITPNLNTRLLKPADADQLSGNVEKAFAAHALSIINKLGYDVYFEPATFIIPTPVHIENSPHQHQKSMPDLGICPAGTLPDPDAMKLVELTGLPEVVMLRNPGKKAQALVMEATGLDYIQVSFERMQEALDCSDSTTAIAALFHLIDID